MMLRARRVTNAVRKRATKNIPVQAYPHGAERDYTRGLLGIVRDMHAATLAAYDAVTRVRLDAKDKPPPGLKGAIEEVAKKKRRSLKLDTGVKDTAAKIEKANRRAIGAQLKGVVGFDPLAQGKGIPQSLIDQWVRENVALIKTIPERYFSQVIAVIEDGYLKGRSQDDTRRLIQERFRVSEFNARRIARDQTGKLNGKLTETRQRSIGITRYKWVHSRAKHPRELHMLFDGRVFLWDAPPPQGHPGQAIGCGCRAEPVISDAIDLI